MFKDFLVAISLANLCFVRVWHDLLDRPSTSPLNDYFIKSASSLRIESVAAMIAVLALAALLWTGRTVARRSTHLFVKRFASSAFMLLSESALRTTGVSPWLKACSVLALGRL